ncbi:MAG TPA: transglutaminaseTgpA domain-containing protein [Myxococcales bacterium]|nr:transglutaminaseTgpA domain-containing protein [Myxococcales bacterium]
MSALRGLTLLRAQEWAGTLALAAAFGACAVSGELGTGLLLLFVAAGAAASILRPDTRRYEWAWTTLLGAAFLLQAAQVLAGRLDIVLGAAQFTVLLAIHRLWHRGSRRDEWLLLLLSLLLVCAGAALSAELLFGVCFLAYVVAATWALALTYLRFEIESARTPEHAAMLLKGRRLVTPGVLISLASLSLAALVGSAAIFVAFPRVTLGGLRRSSASIPIAGLGDQIDLLQHGVIADDPRVVLRVRLDPSPPRGADLTTHWRARSLEVWTGRGWRARTDSWGGSSWTAPIPPVRLAEARRRPEPLVADIEAVGGFSAGVVLVPDGWPTSVAFRVPLSLRGPQTRLLRAPNGDLFYTPAEIGDMHYVVRTERALPDLEQLRGRGSSYPRDVLVDLEVPDRVDERVQRLSRLLTAGKDPVDAAAAVENWLSRSLGYTRELPGPQPDPIAHFLFGSRRGHCELFSSAMVILLRLAGIPARNVTGYYGGVYTSAGYWAVRAGDAHSWVEVYVPGAGFVTFDPTPPAGRGSAQSGLWADALLFWDGVAQRWRAFVVDYDLLSQQRTVARIGEALRDAGRRLSRARPGTPEFREAAIQTGLAGLVIVAGIILLRKVRRRGAVAAGVLTADQRRARKLWQRTRDRLQREGVHLARAVSPREAIRWIAQRQPGAAPAVERLASAVLAARWGGERLSPGQARALLRDLHRQLQNLPGGQPASGAPRAPEA